MYKEEEVQYDCQRLFLLWLEGNSSTWKLLQSSYVNRMDSCCLTCIHAKGWDQLAIDRNQDY